VRPGGQAESEGRAAPRPLMRVGLIIAYDGTRFHGSQTQADCRTVHSEIERKLETIYGRRVRLSLASRTDAGVHAKGQVGAFDIDTSHSCETIRDALNHNLDDDVRVLAAEHVPERFDPRRNALAREYVYTVTDAAVPSPLTRAFEGPVRAHLDHAAMDRAARMLEGDHDFRSFAGPAASSGASTVRSVHRAAVARQGTRVKITVAANAFVHQQMRRIAGVLVDIGRMGLALEDLVSLLEHPRRGAAGRLMPARGLCLTRIDYSSPGETGLPAHNGPVS